MFLGVFLGHLFEFLWFFSQLLRHGFFEGVIRLGGFHHRVHHGQAVLGVECWPPGSHHVHTDISRIQLDGRMVNRGHESQSGRLEGVLCRKFNPQSKFSAGIRRTVGALDLAIPFEHVLLDQANIINEWERILCELCSFLFWIGLSIVTGNRKKVRRGIRE